MAFLIPLIGEGIAALAEAAPAVASVASTVGEVATEGSTIANAASGIATAANTIGTYASKGKKTYDAAKAFLGKRKAQSEKPLVKNALTLDSPEANPDEFSAVTLRVGGADDNMPNQRGSAADVAQRRGYFRRRAHIEAARNQGGAQAGPVAGPSNEHLPDHNNQTDPEVPHAEPPEDDGWADSPTDAAIAQYSSPTGAQTQFAQ